MRFIFVIWVFILVLSNRIYSKENPNIIIIYTDDQGYGDSSLLNSNSKFQTPNIDRIGKEGITFTDAHSPDTVCTPSRYGLLTGRYSWRTQLKRGVFGAEHPCLIKNNRLTIASYLKSSGYQTAMVGKWHLGMDFPGTKGNRDWSKPTKDMPLDKGFDYFWGIPASMNYGVLAWFNGRHPINPPTLFTRKKPNKIAISDYRIKSPYEVKSKAPDDLEVAKDFEDDKCLTFFTEKAKEWIQSRNKNKPFFLYLSYTSPHKPVIPLPEFRGKGKAGAYGEFMIETDHHVGEILETLDKENISENTMVIFSSDNGPENTWGERAKKYKHQSNYTFRGGKRSIYEGGHRVPFFVRWPIKIQSDQKSNAPICQTDIFATIAEVIDKKIPTQFAEDSNSFFQELTDQDSKESRPAIIHHSSSGRFAIREGKWKLVMEGRKKSEKRELYDLINDPKEKTNVIKDHPKINSHLTKKISAIISNGRSSPGPPSQNDTPPWNDLVWMKDKNN